MIWGYHYFRKHPYCHWCLLLLLVKGSLNRNFRQYGELKSSRVVRSVDRRCNSQKVSRKKIHPREMLEKSRNAVFFQWSVCQVSRKVGLLKRRVRRLAFCGGSKNCTPLWRNAHLQVKMYKTPHSEHLLKFWCPKIARRCGETHILKSKCTKHLKFGPLFEVEMSKNARRCGETHILKSKCTKHLSFGALFEVLMSKNCTPLWRNAHLQVKMYKTPHARTTFWSSDVEKLHAAVAKRTFASENLKKLTVSEHFLKFRCRKIARRCGETHICKWKCTKYLCFRTLFEVQMSKISQLASSSVNQSVR